MSKDPAFLFYPNDWLGGTMGMTFEEKGAYMELLMMQFNRGHMTSHMIGQTIGQLWDKVKDKFVQDEAGLWYNIRLEIEKEKRQAFVNTRRNNIKGVNQHTKKKNKNGGHMGGHMTSHMENENNNSIHTKNKELYTIWKESSNNDSYKRFVSFVFGDNPSGEELTEVLKLKNQITESKFEKLLDISERTKVKISDKLIEIEKHQRTAPNNKKQKDLNLTLISWMNYKKK